MNTLIELLSCSAAIASAFAVAPCAAQGPEKFSDGPLVAVPHGLSTDPMSSSILNTENRLQVKRIGYKDESMPGGKPADFPPPIPTPGNPVPPDFSTVAIMQLPLAVLPDMDGFSVGLDWINSDGDGVEIVPPGHWGGVTFSLDRSATGLAGSVIERESLDTTQGTGGDLFFYIFPDSALPPSLIDRTFLTQDASEMDIDEAGLQPEMDAHDLFVSLVYADNPSKAALLPPPIDIPRAFFSVTDATKAVIPVGWLGGMPSARSGATIFYTEWIGGIWTPITPFLLPGQLSLAADEEVDAVAVDLVRCELLFSTKTPARDQILWMSLAGAVLTSTGPLCSPVVPGPSAGGGGAALNPVKTYRRPSGTPIKSRARVSGTDDLDAICALDPGAPFWSELFGRPASVLASTGPLSSSSVFVQEDVISQTAVYRTTLVGWPPPGRQPGALVCLLQFPGFTPLFDFYANASRDLGNIFLGGPEETQIQIPLVHGLIGFQLDFQWVAIDVGTFDLDFPLASRIVL